ncbi:MAG: hypothetical protein WC781_00300 [Candidatus Pacearchaeota archaeon]
MKEKLMVSLILAMLFCMPFGFAITSQTTTTAGVNVGIVVTPGNSAPEIWQNYNERQLQDTFGNPLTRANNYAFTGEKIKWQVLVRDLNGKDDIASVLGTVGPNQGSGNSKEVGCLRSLTQPEQQTTISWAGGLIFNPKTDVIYNCLLTVEPGFLGEYWAQVVATDNVGGKDNVRENSFFWFNPSIALQVLDANNGLVFTEKGKALGVVTPGNTGYSQSIRLKSAVATGSGVILDVEIKGKDFYDSSSSGTACPTSNQLTLSNFRYFATKGSFSTKTSPTKDSEGYDTIGYTYADLIKGAGAEASKFSEGTEATLTFKLNLPNPCAGNFVNSGGFEFQGTAI